MNTIDLVISGDGQIKAVWDDALAGLGEARIVRASHVEPFKSGWTADMRPSGGPVLFLDGAATDESDWLYSMLTPFKTRGEALDAERKWLRENRGL